MCLISPRYIKEVEDKIKDSLVEEIIGEVIGLSVEIAMKVTEDMDMVEVIFGEATLGEVIFEVDITIEWIEVGKIEHGDQSRSRERERRGRSPSSSRLGSRTSTNRDRIRCFKCREYDHFVNECPNLIPEDSDKEGDSARSISLHLADSDTGSDTEQYLNI